MSLSPGQLSVFNIRSTQWLCPQVNCMCSKVNSACVLRSAVRVSPGQMCVCVPRLTVRVCPQINCACVPMSTVHVSPGQLCVPRSSVQVSPGRLCVFPGQLCVCVPRSTQHLQWAGRWDMAVAVVCGETRLPRVFPWDGRRQPSALRAPHWPHHWKCRAQHQARTLSQAATVWQGNALFGGKQFLSKWFLENFVLSFTYIENRFKLFIMIIRFILNSIIFIKKNSIKLKLKWYKRQIFIFLFKII